MMRGILGLVAICAMIVLLALVGLAWDFRTRLVLDIDGLLLLFVCLMMGGLFLLMLLLIAKDAGWLPLSRRKRAAEPVPAANPANRLAKEGK